MSPGPEAALMAPGALGALVVIGVGVVRPSLILLPYAALVPIGGIFTIPAAPASAVQFTQLGLGRDRHRRGRSACLAVWTRAYPVPACCGVVPFPVVVRDDHLLGSAAGGSRRRAEVGCAPHPVDGVDQPASL